jgi:hypothetical protein
MQHSAQDRCDKCHAQGYTTWGLSNNLLTFCGHHTRSYAHLLRQQRFRLLVDDTRYITEMY